MVLLVFWGLAEVAKISLSPGRRRDEKTMLQSNAYYFKRLLNYELVRPVQKCTLISFDASVTTLLLARVCRSYCSAAFATLCSYMLLHVVLIA